jgi:hypothetical protein
MPDPSTPCGQATPKTALWPFLGWPPCRAGGPWLSSTPLNNLRRTDLISKDLNLFRWKEKTKERQSGFLQREKKKRKTNLKKTEITKLQSVKAKGQRDCIFWGWARGGGGGGCDPGPLRGIHRSPGPPDNVPWLATGTVCDSMADESSQHFVTLSYVKIKSNNVFTS